MSDNEPRYTLKEARRILKRQECSIWGHDITFVLAGGEPVRSICQRCGDAWSMEKCDASSTSR